MRPVNSLAALLLCFSGCVGSIQTGSPAISADIACETAYAVLGYATAPDAPNNGDQCDSCGGTGKVGDGRVFVKCAACDGTGKKKQETPKQKAVTARPLPTCTNGVCLQ